MSRANTHLVGVFVLLSVLAVPASLRAQGGRGGADAGPLPSIEEKTDGMQKIEGFVPLYWEESTGKMWMEVARWDTDLLHINGIGAGLGSNDLGIDRGAGAGSRVVRFHRVGPRVMMVQPNYRFRASSSNPEEVRAVEDAFAPATLFGFTAAAETDRRVLVDATDFFVRDPGSMARRLRPGTYRLDASRSAIYMPMTMGFPENTEVEVSLTFVLQPGGQGGGGFGGGGDADGFQSVGDVAASGEAPTIRIHHSFVQLPELGEYTPRAFDPRAGFGASSYEDYSVPLGESMTRRAIRRHRLEKRDPSQAVSDPVEPIVYYLDPGTPEPVRSALLEGASWWNEAFEAAGFRNAFQVRMRPPEVSSHDVRYNVINWVHRSTRGWSTGGSVTDPRTGEILKGLVTLGSLRIRQDYMIAEGLLSPYENGDETPPELAEWALARVRQLSAHEVGHTIGLGHNYYNSRAGRISVMDYPHPLVTLEGGRLDYSEVYDVGIGEWDKVAITYGYADFPPGTDEEAALARILDDAWDDDIRYLSNQDISTHPLADQWANGNNPSADLDRMMAVRRFALNRFGERAIKTGAPMATLEEVLVPLYMHHRYQVESSASALGGVNYIYAMRGDGRTPVEPVSGDVQRAVLRSLLATLDPAELAIPERVLEMLPPRPGGYGRTREMFPRYTGPMFDAISPAVVAADHTIGQILRPDRAARMVEQNALDPYLPGLDEVIQTMAGAAAPRPSDSPYEAEIRRAVRRVVTERVMNLAGSAPMPQVRAIATTILERTAYQLNQATATVPSGQGPLDPDHAHSRLLARDIGRFLNRPAEPYQGQATPNAPPGAPIGMPAMDFLGGSAAEWWNLHRPAPYCSHGGGG